MTIHAGQQIHKNILNCSTCGFVHWHPLPDASAITKLYEGDNFYAGDKPHSPPDWFLKEREEYMGRYWDSYFSYLASFLDRNKPVIDIGAGAGWFVHWCLWRWVDSPLDNACGVEPSRIAREFSPVTHRLIPNMDFSKDLSGNIVLMLTLEHILDPETWLREEVLPHLDGRLIVVVPNEFSPLQGLAGGKANPWFVSKVHLNYFTPKTLRGLLERLGLVVVHESGTFPTELAILLGYDYRGNNLRGRRVHNFRLRLERRFPGVFRWLYAPLYKYLHWGREIIMVAEKR